MGKIICKVCGIDWGIWGHVHVNGAVSRLPKPTVTAKSEVYFKSFGEWVSTIAGIGVATIIDFKK